MEQRKEVWFYISNCDKKIKFKLFVKQFFFVYTILTLILISSLFFFASVFVCCLFCLVTSLFICLFVCLFISLFICLFTCLFLCLSVFHPPLFLYCHVMHYQYKLISYLTILTKLFSPRYESKKLLCSNGTMRFIQCFQKVIVRYQRYEQFLRWYII